MTQGVRVPTRASECGAVRAYDAGCNVTKCPIVIMTEGVPGRLDPKTKSYAWRYKAALLGP